MKSSDLKIIPINDNQKRLELRIVIDRDGIILSANKNFQRPIDLLSNRLVGQKSFDFIQKINRALLAGKLKYAHLNREQKVFLILHLFNDHKKYVKFSQVLRRDVNFDRFAKEFTEANVTSRPDRGMKKQGKDELLMSVLFDRLDDLVRSASIMK